MYSIFFCSPADAFTGHTSSFCMQRIFVVAKTDVNSTLIFMNSTSFLFQLFLLLVYCHCFCFPQTWIPCFLPCLHKGGTIYNCRQILRTAQTEIKRWKSSKKMMIETETLASMVVDTYIPYLPDPAVHQILSFVSPKLAARSSIVSKQWARIWDSLPALVFDEDEKICTDSHRRKLFMNYIRNCLKRRKRDQCDLEKFGLRMRYNGGASTMNRCLSFAIERNVKELDICIIRRKMFGKLSRLCYLSSTVFSSAKSLTILKLEGVNLKESIHPMRLLSLKTMSLESVEFNNTSHFLHLVSGCPSIENLLVTSSTLGSPVDTKVHSISSSSLKSLELTQCRRPVYKIEAMNIESLKLDGWADDISSCQKTTSLDLFCTYLPCHYFNDLDSRYPLLESLTLHKCWWEDTEHMNISSQHLKRFVLFENDMQLKVSTNFPNLLQATCILWDAIPSYLRLSYLGEFLKQFDCSRKTSLQVTDAKGIIFPEEIRNTWSPPFPTLKHLEVEIISSTTAVNDYVLIDSLHWMAPSLEFLSIKQNS